MSTTNPSFVSIDSDIENPRFDHVWPDDGGRVVATVRLGNSKIFFRSPAHARAMAAACTEAAEAMEAAASEPRPEPETT